MKINKDKWADSAGRRHLIQLSVLTNIGLFAVINILLVALVHTDSHVDPNISAFYTLKVFIWSNAIAAVVTAVAAPYALSTFERMQQRLTRQNNELRTLHAIDTAISAELNLDTILQVAVRHTTMTVDGEFGSLWLFADRDAAVVEAHAFYKVPSSLQPLFKEYMVESIGRNTDETHPNSSVQRIESAQRRRNLELNWEHDHALAALKLRSIIVVPIMQQETAIGALFVANRGESLSQPHGFTTEDEDLLTAIITTVGVAVQNSRLYEETQRRGGMLRSLVARIGDAIAASSDASLLMQVLADEAQGILGSARVAVYDFDDAQEQFLPLAASDQTSQGRGPVDQFFRQPLDMDLILPPEADNPAADHYYDNVRETLGLDPDIGHFLNHPGFLFVLRSREHNCIGLLCILDERARPPSHEAWAFAHALASQAAVALENARLAERTHALLAQARALQDATNKIAAELDIDRVLEGVMDSARSVLAADGYAIWDLNPASNEWTKRAGHGLEFSPTPTGEVSVPRELDALELVLREQSPLVIANTAHAPIASTLHLNNRGEDGSIPGRGEGILPRSSPALRTPVRALLALPLLYGGKTTGVMALYYKSPHTFIPAEVGLAQSFAHQAANALENARMFAELNAMYKREKRIAGELQRSLLPPIPPEVGQFNISYRYQAGLDEAAVGGDFLDLFFLGPQTIGLVIADVSGKGLPAAVQTAMIKYTLRAFAGEMPKNPAEVMDRVNNVLCNRSTAIQGFVTLFYGVLDAQTGVLTYANAGHELPLLCDGETGWVCGLPVADGIALGCMPNMDFQNRTVILDPGSMLLLYTDGLTEARASHDEFLGIDGLRRFVSCGDGDVETSIQSIYDRVVEYAGGGDLVDDVAMLLVQRKPDALAGNDRRKAIAATPN